MRHARDLLILLVILSIIALPLFYILHKKSVAEQEQNRYTREYYKAHIIGGFSIDTPERATQAALDGVRVALEYNPPPSENGTLGRKLLSLHMRVIDGYISSYLSGYECHRIKTVKPHPAGQEDYCRADNYPNLTDKNVLLAAIAAHLKEVQDNQLVIGYWVLDDWPSWDAGSARQILVKIRDLIQYYTPGLPAICGFGGFIHPGHTYGWGDWIADNFSPQGCDFVGFYIYAPDVPDTVQAPSPDVYGWSMSALLPAMFASLQQRGWDMRKEPLIGIGQAFGGPISNTSNYWVTPDAKDIETQSKSFCEHGATGLAFYSWDDTKFGPKTQTPLNDSEIEIGIQKGIRACYQYWAAHP